jgi:hypothetical protein
MPQARNASQGAAHAQKWRQHPYLLGAMLSLGLLIWFTVLRNPGQHYGPKCRASILRQDCWVIFARAGMRLEGCTPGGSFLSRAAQCTYISRGILRRVDPLQHILNARQSAAKV